MSKSGENYVPSKLSDEQIIDRLRDSADAEDVFAATSGWSLEKMRQSIQSRGDFFKRDGFVVFECNGNELMRVCVCEMPATVGRGEHADYRIDGEGISRLHCRLERVGNLVRLCDAGSKNGTLLNGKDIDYEDLCDGDEVQLGSVSMRVKRA